MASQIQKVQYEGYIGADPELRYTPDGKPVCNFRLGSTNQYKNASGEVVKETTWLKIATWGKLAEIVNAYCAVGSHVIVQGRLRPDENGSPSVYELKTGGHGASFEMTANEVRILSGKDKDAVTEDAPY